MKLNVLERIILMGILPQESSYVTFKILLDLRAAVSFTEKEHREYGIKQVGEQVTWTKNSEKDIQIGERATEIIREALKKLDEQGKISAQNATLYEKFML